MARPSKSRRIAAPGIEIDVAGVSPTTRVGDLTVSQLVELVAQTVAQVQVAQRLDPAAITTVLAQLRAGIPKSSGSRVEAQVHDMQRELLDRMPGLLQGLRNRISAGRKSSRKA